MFLGGRSPSRGIAVLSRIPFSLLQADEYNVWIEVSNRSSSMTVHAAYWPCAGLQAQRIACQCYLDAAARFIGNGSPIISGGDFNVRLASAGDLVSNTEGRALRKATLDLGLYHWDLDWNKLQGGPSREQILHLHNGTTMCQKSTPDHGFASVHAQNLLQHAAFIKDLPTSDHYPLVTQWKFQAPKFHFYAIPKFITTPEGDEAFKQEVNDISAWNGAHQSASEFSSRMLHFAELSYVQSNSEPPKRSPLPKVARHLANDLKHLQSVAETRPSQQLFQRISSVAMRLRTIIRRSKMAAKALDCRVLDFLQKDGREYWRLFNNMRRSRPYQAHALHHENGTVITDPLDIKQRWIRHFSNLASSVRDAHSSFDEQFKSRLQEDCASIRRDLPNNPELDVDITPMEVLKTISKMKNGTAPGDDGLLINFFKAACAEELSTLHHHGEDVEFGPFLLALVELLQNVMLSGEWPDMWRVGLIYPLFKKKDLLDPNNYRGITLLSVLSKILLSLLATRIQSYVEKHEILSEEQAGFRKFRSCQEQIYNLFSLLTLRLRQGLPTFVCFLDLMKAYDYVWRDAMLVKLRRAGISGRIWRILDSSFRSFYRCMRSDSSHGRLPCQARPCFSQSRGLAQGANDSPIDFDIYVEGLIRDLKRRGLGVQVLQVKVASLFFADDIALIAGSAAELRIALTVVDAYLIKWRLRLNPSPKSAWMLVCPPAMRSVMEPERFYCNGQWLERCENYVYLGALLSEDLSWNNHVQRALASAKKAASFVKSVCFRDASISPRNFCKLYAAVVRPVLEYASEVFFLCLTQALRAKLEAFQNGLLKDALGVPLRFPNVAVRLELGMQSIASRLEGLSLRFFSRLCSFPPQRIGHQVCLAAFQQRIPWARDVKRLIRSLVSPGRPLPPPDQSPMAWLDYLNNHAVSIQDRDEVNIRLEVQTMPSLLNYFQLRCWKNVNRTYAWAKSHIGRRSHRHCELYLDSWVDRKGARLKLQARTGCLWWRLYASNCLLLEEEDSFCDLCDSQSPQTYSHLFFQCPGTQEDRLRLWGGVQRALERLHPDPHHPDLMTIERFFLCSPTQKMNLALGSPSGVPGVDKLIDALVRRFLRNVDVLARFPSNNEDE